MALTGQAKRDYQREYMRKRRSANKLDPVRPKAPNVRPNMLDPVVNIKTPADILNDLKAKTQGIIDGKPQTHTQPPVDDLPPFYDKGIHKPGDRVRVRQGAGWIIQTVPDMDAEGNILYD